MVIPMFNLKMSKKTMRKFWSLMLVALVTLGAAACTETDENVDKTPEQSAGLSFYAEISNDATRADLEYDADNKMWNTVWEGNETLVVTCYGDNDETTDYRFSNSETEKNKFTCTDDGVENIIGKVVTISNEDSIYSTSRSGKKTLFVHNVIDEFSVEEPIKLTSEISFLRYTYNGEGSVTLNVSFNNGVEDVDVFYEEDDNGMFGESVSEITFDGIQGENWVAVWPHIQSGSDYSATLSYSIDGVKCKEATINGFGYGKVYNLGTLTEPEVEMATIYFSPGVWNVDGAWFSAHVWNTSEAIDVKLTDEDADGIYECEVPADMTNVIFCRMNPAFTEFAWNEEGATDENLHVWNQTADLEIGIAPNNYYYITGWETGEWSDENGVKVPEFSVGIVGFGNWEVDTDMTLEGDYYTLKGVAVAATNNTFKIRISDSWAENYGISSADAAEDVAINKDTMYALVQDGKNMQLAEGTYDLYFNYTTKEFYAMTPGTTPDELGVPQYKIYVHPYNNVWTKYNLYSWDAAGANPTGGWPGATSTVTETINGYTYYVWTMPRSATGASLNIIINDGTSQTPDFALGTLNKDYYLLLNGSVLSIVEDKENPEPEVIQGEPQPSTWALAGDFNSWGDKVMYTTNVDNLFVAKSVTIGAYKEIKVKEVGNWNNSYGGGINYLNANIWTKAYSGGSNFAIINAGVYDVYFDNTNKRIYVMNEGVDYSTATEQSTNGAAPDLSGASWGLCGTHNNWSSPDIQLFWDGTISLYVAKSAKLTGEFKVRANNSWGEDYGCGGTITVNSATGKTMTRGGGNCKVASGTYDVYFDLTGKKIWVKTPGSAAPTK